MPVSSASRCLDHDEDPPVVECAGVFHRADLRGVVRSCLLAARVEATPVRLISLRRDIVGMDVSLDLNGHAWTAPILSDYLRVVILGIPLPKNWFVHLYRRVISRRKLRKI